MSALLLEPLACRSLLRPLAEMPLESNVESAVQCGLAIAKRGLCDSGSLSFCRGRLHLHGFIGGGSGEVAAQCRRCGSARERRSSRGRRPAFRALRVRLA